MNVENEKKKEVGRANVCSRCSKAAFFMQT